jgi:hypothetical protein
MKRSTIIATCLVNSSIVNRIEDAEHLVRSVFIREFPSDDFNYWNCDINDDTAQNIMRNVGRASRINVKAFIDELRNTR